MSFQKPWCLWPEEEVLKKLKVKPSLGLSAEEAKVRLEQYGPNLLQKKKKRGVLDIFLDQFRDFMVLVLLAATFFSGLLEEYYDAITIMVIVILNACLGFFQEYKAERSFEELQKLTAPRAKVIRDGLFTDIASQELVPGDLVILEAGDKVGADVRLLEADNLTIDESPLTGESLVVAKKSGRLKKYSASLGDQRNMAFGGTMIASGRGKGVVVATGMSSEMGKIAALIQEADERSTPLQRKLASLGKVLVAICFLLCALMVLWGVIRGEPFYRMIMAGVSLAVAAIPEGLPAIVTISLAIGVQRMARRKAIVRKLPAVETLGCASVICTDKTGTLTQNAIEIACLYADGQLFKRIKKRNKVIYGSGEKMIDPEGSKLFQQVLQIGGLCHNVQHSQKGSLKGDPTEIALFKGFLEAGGKESMEKRVKKRVKVKELSFDSYRKRMTVIYRENNNYKVYTKGAPEKVLARCSHVLEKGMIRPLDDKRRKIIMLQLEKMASQAYRNIAVAYKPLQFHGDKNLEKADVIEKDLIFAGIFGLLDPPRPEVYEAVQKCKKAGIRVIMITGDHKTTAVSIAKKLNMLPPYGKVMTGEEIDLMPVKKFFEIIDQVYVFARVNPEHKLRIVKALKKKGHIVAMTGDGINDAPAIKEADIGVAMGASGTEVSKEAASLVLADDNFRTIVAAVEEGRNIYLNIRKFIRFLLGCNIGEILTMLLAVAMSLPLPLSPIQILWVNLITDGLPALALGLEPAEPGAMSRPPRSPREGVFSGGLGWRILARGILIGLSTIMMFIFYLSQSSLLQAQTVAFTTLICTQLAHVFECRSESIPPWQLKLMSNPYLPGSVLVSLFLTAMVLYCPFMQKIFSTVPLSVFDWFLIFAVSIFPYIFSIVGDSVKSPFPGKKLLLREQ